MRFAEEKLGSAGLVYGYHLTRAISNGTRDPGCVRVDGSCFVFSVPCCSNGCIIPQDAAIVPEDETLLWRVNNFSPYIVLLTCRGRPLLT